MFSKFSSKLASVVKSVDVRMIVFLLMLVLFVLGAGAPGATGINGG
ncbi:MAG TPA: hypothetical protein VK856_00715 [Anaerolineaceae bacterium]|nr:hypothetical protein [Anaerolineaceae bacterium]